MGKWSYVQEAIAKKWQNNIDTQSCLTPKAVLLISFLMMIHSEWMSAQSCLTLWPMDCSPPSSSVHGLFQAKILEWVAISYSKGSSWPRDWTGISCTGRLVLYRCATWEAPDRVDQVSFQLVSNFRKCFNRSPVFQKGGWLNFSLTYLITMAAADKWLEVARDSWMLEGGR